MKPSTEESSLGNDRTVPIKLTQDMTIGYGVVELLNAKIVVKKDTTIDELQNKPLAEIKEAQL